MDNIITTICQALQTEAEAVKNYTYGINHTSDDNLNQTFAINRLDAVEHIQNLTIALTNAVSASVTTSEDDV